MRCKIPELCDENGAYVVVTDFGVGDRTDFIMSPRGYSNLGKNGDASAELFKYGVVDIEYKRIPCKYNGYNILFKVHERSKNPHYLAILILYVGGTNDVTAVQLWQVYLYFEIVNIFLVTFLEIELGLLEMVMEQEDCQEWRPMRRAFGTVFDAENPPRGEIKLRLQVSGSAGLYWVESKTVISSDWEAGAVYDSQIQFD